MVFRDVEVPLVQTHCISVLEMATVLVCSTLCTRMLYLSRLTHQASTASLSGAIGDSRVYIRYVVFFLPCTSFPSPIFFFLSGGLVVNLVSI